MPLHDFFAPQNLQLHVSRLLGNPWKSLKKVLPHIFLLNSGELQLKRRLPAAFKCFFSPLRIADASHFESPLTVTVSERAGGRKHLNDGRLSVPRERCKVYISLQALKTRIRALTNEEAALTGCEFLPYLINQRFQSGVY